MLRWAGISALVVAASVAFMTAGSGRAAEHPEAPKAGPAGKETAPATATGKDAAPAAKEPAKAGGSAPGPAGAEAAAKPDKTNKADGAAKTTTAEKPAEPGAPPKRSKSKRKHDGTDAEPELPPGQGPPPPSPLTVNDLRQEAHHERSPGGEFEAPPRVKLEQLLSEVGKARQSLHEDTLKLEAMAGNEPAKEADPAAAAVAPAPGAPGQPAQKNPLDVLAKALRGIKPEQAGPIVARLDKGLAATVLLKMPPADAGKIMGALKPEVAAELATQIAMRAPQPGGKR